MTVIGEKRRFPLYWKIALPVIIAGLVFAGYKGYNIYHDIYSPNVSLKPETSAYFYIPTGAGMEDVVKRLYEKNYIMDKASFEWVAEKKNYKRHVHPGRYLIRNNMSNNALINLLRSGKQEPVKVVINNRLIFKHELAARVAEYLETDSVSLVQLLGDEQFADKYGFNTRTILCMIIPNTYYFNWNTSAEEFFGRMAAEYKKFWTDKRKQRAGAIGLSQSEVAVLASIVELETLMEDEKSRIAGVYINRLRKRMLLQADPTVKYALGDFSIRRVLKKHTRFDSPYNTYKYPGLPPGPICLPSISTMDAVLYHEEHDYLFFCAKEDFSFFLNFAKTLRQHSANARRYQKALNERGIR